MYKDKDKQREANRLAAKRYRDKRKGMTEYDDKRHTQSDNVIPKHHTHVIPEVQAMIDDVQANGGAYTFTTNKDKIQDIHHTPPKPQSYNPMMVGYVRPGERT